MLANWSNTPGKSSFATLVGYFIPLIACGPVLRLRKQCNLTKKKTFQNQNDETKYIQTIK
jgi:hypothetical protein